jgi:hypothetical protein
MTTLAERVLADVERRLAQIPTSACGASLRVLRARRSLSDSELPALVVWDDGEQVAPGTGAGNATSMTITLAVTVEAHVPANQADTGRALERAKAAVKRALCTSGGAIRDADGAIGVLAYTGADPSARADGMASEAVSLRFEATYKEAFGDPDKAR